MALKNKQNRTIVLNFTEKMYDSFMEDQEIAHQIDFMNEVKKRGVHLFGFLPFRKLFYG